MLTTHSGVFSLLGLRVPRRVRNFVDNCSTKVINALINSLSAHPGSGLPPACVPIGTFCSLAFFDFAPSSIVAPRSPKFTHYPLSDVAKMSGLPVGNMCTTTLPQSNSQAKSHAQNPARHIGNYRNRRVRRHRRKKSTNHAREPVMLRASRKIRKLRNKSPLGSFEGGLHSSTRKEGATCFSNRNPKPQPPAAPARCGRQIATS